MAPEDQRPGLRKDQQNQIIKEEKERREHEKREQERREREQHERQKNRGHDEGRSG
jgi:hypothetical protein